MSHTVRMSQVKLNPESTKQALEDALFADWEVTEQGETTFYDRRKREGILAKPQGWRYPIVVNDDGEVIYDNYNGSWGDTQDVATLVGASLAVESGFGLEGVTITEEEDELVMVFVQ